MKGKEGTGKNDEVGNKEKEKRCLEEERMEG